MATNPGDLGKFLSMMDFLVVVLFLDHLDMQQEFLLQSYELMINTSSVRLTSPIIHPVLIRLGSYLFMFLTIICRQMSDHNAYSCGFGVVWHFYSAPVRFYLPLRVNVMQ